MEGKENLSLYESHGCILPLPLEPERYKKHDNKKPWALFEGPHSKGRQFTEELLLFTNSHVNLHSYLMLLVFSNQSF